MVASIQLNMRFIPIHSLCILFINYWILIGLFYLNKGPIENQWVLFRLVTYFKKVFVL